MVLSWSRTQSLRNRLELLGWFSHRVAMSVCLSVGLPHHVQFFRPLIGPVITVPGFSLVLPLSLSPPRFYPHTSRGWVVSSIQNCFRPWWWNFESDSSRNSLDFKSSEGQCIWMYEEYWTDIFKYKGKYELNTKELPDNQYPKSSVLSIHYPYTSGNKWGERCAKKVAFSPGLTEL